MKSEPRETRRIPTKLGCKYADEYYAQTKDISEEDARGIYKCTDGCPFDFLDDCVLENAPATCRGILAGLLANRAVSCSLQTLELYSPYPHKKTFYICTHCKERLVSVGKAARYCYRCGAKIWYANG